MLFGLIDLIIRANDNIHCGGCPTMMNPNQRDPHIQHQDITSQHWSFSSERFAGGDNLLTALARGWEIESKVILKRHWFAGMRCIEIFHFTIKRGAVIAEMAVIGNPYVYRFLADYPIELVEEDAAKA